MKLTKKTNSFTLSEILVVLVISSIVIASAFLILSMVQKQFRTVQTNMNNKYEVNFIERLLWQDFNSQHSISFQKEKNLLTLTNNIDSVTYSFFDNFTLRNIDTLPIQIIKTELFLEGEKTESGKIDAIKITTSPFYGNRKIFIYTSKDATFYMNQ